MIPQTEIELEKWMKERCFNFNGYSVNGNAIFEGCGIDRIGGEFIWYYTERGEKRNLKTFKTEKDLIDYAYEEVKSDKWARTHCIGFTSNKNESLELKNQLGKLGIEFIEDEIPYYGVERIVYRTFVLGCDSLKVEDLKRKYYKENEN